MSVWVGGVAALVLVVPAATRALAPAQRTPLLAETVRRFSAFALLAVAAIVATGVLQAIVELHALSDLWRSAFGRAILVKSALVIGLVALGAWNRTRARPRLERAAAAGDSPGAAGVLLRRALLAELALMACVLGATAALASYAPPTAARGPFAGYAALGPARLELTVDPARTGFEPGPPLSVRSPQRRPVRPRRRSCACRPACPSARHRAAGAARAPGRAGPLDRAAGAARARRRLAADRRGARLRLRPVRGAARGAGSVTLLFYLAPLLALVCVLLLGRYPGERALHRRVRARRPARRRGALARPRTPRPRGLLPRGGALLADGLAGRAPPLGSQ